MPMLLMFIASSMVILLNFEGLKLVFELFETNDLLWVICCLGVYEDSIILPIYYIFEHDYYLDLFALLFILFEYIIN